MKRVLLAAWLLLLAGWSQLASAQSLPVTITVSGNVANIRVTSLHNLPMVDVILTFDQATGLTASSLGVSAKLVSLTDPALLARLPGVLQLNSGLPVLVTIEPPLYGGLVQRRVTHIELHTHLLAYTAGSPFRLFKAPLDGQFRDITVEVAPGSVRTRGTTPGWSQFLLIPDLRPTDTVIEEKYSALRASIALAPAAERPALTSLLDASETALANGDFATCIAKIEVFRARVAARAGTYIPDTWRATRNVTNVAGELLSGAETLAFSVGFLRDFGH
jgi:hypothetical protein